MGWVSWPLYIFVFVASFPALWWPNIWPKIGFPELFEKKQKKNKLLAQFISYLAFILLGWVCWPLYIFVFLASFPALWWLNIWPKMGFPELFEKTIGSIHFIPGIYPYGASLLTPIHFRVPSLIFGPLVATYLAENGVSRTFWKIYWLNSFFAWRTPTCVAHDCKIEIFIGYFWRRWVVIRAGVYCPHFGHSLLSPVYWLLTAVLQHETCYMNTFWTPLYNHLTPICQHTSC